MAAMGEIGQIFLRAGVQVDQAQFARATSAFGALKTAAAAFVGIWAGGRVAGFLREAADAAGQVEEDANVASLAFGNLRGQVVQWADTQAEAMGRSSFELQRFASQLGILVANYSETDEQTAGIAQNLAQRAVDVASALGETLGVDDADVVRDFRSALAGSSEVMEKYGVNVKVAGLEEEARRQGIQGAVKDLTEQQKIQLRINAILRQTDRFQDDAANTSESYANQVRAMNNAFADTRIALGRVLLPALTQLVAFLGDAARSLTDLLSQFRNGEGVFHRNGILMHTLRTAALALGVALSGLVVTVLPPLIPLLASAALGFLKTAGAALLAAAPFIALGAAVVLVALLLEDLYTGLTGGQSIIMSAVDAFNHWHDSIRDVHPTLATFIDFIKFTAGGALEFLGDTIWMIVEAFIRLFTFDFDSLFQPLIDFAQKWGEPIREIFDSIANLGRRAFSGDLAFDVATDIDRAFGTNMTGAAIPRPGSVSSSSNSDVRIDQVNIANPDANAEEIAGQLAASIQAEQQRQLNDAAAAVAP